MLLDSVCLIGKNPSNPHFRIGFGERWSGAQSIKCLVCSYEDLSSVFHQPHQELGMAACAYKPRVVEAVTEGYLNLVDWPSQDSLKALP